MTVIKYDNLDNPWIKFYQPGVEPFIDLPDESLVEMFERSCEQAGNKVATVFFGAELTYSQLAFSVLRCAEGLRRLGVSKGDRVAILLPNSPQHLIAFYGIIRLGATVVEHNPMYTAPELADLFTDHRADVAICMDTAIEKLSSQPEEIRPRNIVAVNLLKAFPTLKRLALSLPFPRLKRARASLTNGNTGTMTWESLLSAPPLAQDHPRPLASDLVALQYTSGTSGQPKGAMLTHANLYANALQGSAWMRGARTGKETSYAMLPMFHAFGMTLYVTFGVLKQARQVLFPTPNVDMAVKLMKKDPPAIYCAVPLIYERTAETAKVEGVSLRGVKYCISGAVTLQDKTVKLWEELSGGLLVEGYGLTECSPVALGNPSHPSRRTGTIGIPFPSTYRRVVNPENPSEEVPQGEPGELLLKGPQVFSGYWNSPEQTAEVLLPDGWLRTGDVVTLDDDGFATIVDRLKEIIIVGGFNVSPSEVEEALGRHPAIAQVSVVGAQRSSGDEMVVAAVIPAQGATIDEATIREWAKHRLAAYKVPRRVLVVDELPTSMLGKVMRKQVRDEVATLLK